jgi:hypothetical protein
MDTGLIGTCGLLGCCGGRRRSRSRSRPPRPSSTSRTLQDSFSLPSKAALARFSPPPSMSTSIGPPSVLRPEQAFRPYKEDSDDEGGYIMRAWQPFPQPVYTPVDEAPLPEPKSGFTRVGGGRAHFDSPYAIQGQGSQSVLRQSSDRLRPSWDTNEAPTASMTNVARYPPTVLSSGVPHHARRLSQTAIIEDASLLQHNSAHFAEPSSADSDTFDDGNDSDATSSPKRSWFGLRKGRRASENFSPPEVAPATSPLAEGGQSSFVVVRKKAGTASPASEPAQATAESSARPSFAVLRGAADR